MTEQRWERIGLWAIGIIMGLLAISLILTGCAERGSLWVDDPNGQSIRYFHEKTVFLVGTDSGMWNVHVEGVTMTRVDDKWTTMTSTLVEVGQAAATDARGNRGWVEAAVAGFFGWIAGRFGP